MKNCGLRKAYANGGVPDFADNSMDGLNKRLSYMQQMNGASSPTATLAAAPTAMSASQLQADREAIEDSANQTKMDQLKSQADSITGVGSSGLSQRQKAAALSQLQGEAGKMGMGMDTGISGMSGLSSRQGLSAGMASLTANNAATDFNKTRNLQRLSASYADQNKLAMPGFRQGGTVGVDKDGWIEGPGGVDNVPARVAETGEEIRVGAGERIVNKKQNAALEKLAGAHGMDLDDYLESATGEPVGPSMKQGLRGAVNGGIFRDKDGVIREVPGEPQRTLPPPEPGTNVAVRPVIDRTGGGAQFNPEGSINGESVRVDEGPRVQAKLTAPPPAPPAPPSGSFQAGQVVGKSLNKAKDFVSNNKGNMLGWAGDALAVYNANKLAGEHDPFYNDPNVSVVDKGLQAGRDVIRVGLPLVTGAVGAGAGSVLPGAGTVGGAVGGAGIGMAGSAMIDKEGQAYKDWQAGNDRRKLNGGAVEGSNPGQIDLPITDEMKRKAKYETAKAQQTGRLGATAEWEAAQEKLNAPILAAKKAEEEKQVALARAGNIPGQNHRFEAVTQADRQASDAYGREVDRRTGTVLGGDGMQNMRNRLEAYAKDEGLRSLRNAQMMLRGDGTRFEKGADGKIVITNSGDFDGSTKMAYTDKNGNPTARYENSSEYADAMSDRDRRDKESQYWRKKGAELDARRDDSPEIKARGLRELAMFDAREAAAAKEAQHKEEMGLRRDLLAQQDRHFNTTETRANRQLDITKQHYDDQMRIAEIAARKAAQKEGVEDFDRLVKASGYEGDEATKFTDWFRGNYAGRRQKVGGKDVDVPGFEDMSPDEKRAHMTNAKAMYEWVKQANKSEMKGRTSMATPKRLREREITFDDARKNSLGLPKLYSDDPTAPGLLGDGGILERKYWPTGLGGASNKVIEEVDDKGKGLRRWIRPQIRGEYGPWGSQDTATWLDSLMTK